MKVPVRKLGRPRGGVKASRLVRFLTSMPDVTLKKLEAMAERSETSVSAVIQYACERLLEQGGMRELTAEDEARIDAMFGDDQ